MATLHAKSFPGESKTYRTQRNKLLREEIKLRRQIEAVAALRRKLPQGGPVKEDYVFEEMSANAFRNVRAPTICTPSNFFSTNRSSSPVTICSACPARAASINILSFGSQQTRTVRVARTRSPRNAITANVCST